MDTKGADMCDAHKQDMWKEAGLGLVRSCGECSPVALHTWTFGPTGNTILGIFATPPYREEISVFFFDYSACVKIGTSIMR